MAYLTKTDLLSVIKLTQLNAMVGDDDAIITAAMAQADQKIYNCIHQNYNADTEFALTGTNRNQELVMHGVNITMFNLMRRLPANQRDPETGLAYEMSMKTLEDISKGKMQIDISRQTYTDLAGETQTDAGGIYFVTNARRGFE